MLSAYVIWEFNYILPYKLLTSCPMFSQEVTSLLQGLKACPNPDQSRRNICCNPTVLVVRNNSVLCPLYKWMSSIQSAYPLSRFPFWFSFLAYKPRYPELTNIFPWAQAPWLHLSPSPSSLLPWKGWDDIPAQMSHSQLRIMFKMYWSPKVRVYTWAKLIKTFLHV